MKHINYNPSRVIPATKAPVAFDRITLKPGDNYMADSDYAILEKHPDLQQYVKWGAIALLGAIESEPEPGVPDITKLTVEQAKKLISAESNLGVLEVWMDDPRKGIQDLVSDRLAAL